MCRGSWMGWDGNKWERLVKAFSCPYMYDKIIDTDSTKEKDYQGIHVYVCDDCAVLIDVINDEWISGKKRDKAISELKEKLQERPE